MIDLWIASNFFIHQPKVELNDLIALERPAFVYHYPQAKSQRTAYKRPEKIVEVVKEEEVIIPTTIPIQVPLDHEKYSLFFKKASSQVKDKSEDCAKFVNRMFLARFNALVFGSAWNLQLKTENQKYMTMKWRLPEDEFLRYKGNQPLALKTDEDRIRHFEMLYDALQKEDDPIGVIGWVYRFSFNRAAVAKHKDWLQQTHVTFIAGRKKFEIKNEGNKEQSVQDLLEAVHGGIHDFERDFVDNIVDLDQVLKPGESAYYDDFLIEEHYYSVMSGSLLELFLRKHRNNRVTPLLRPVSFSSISDDLAEQVKRQKRYLQKLGNIDFVSGAEFAESDSWSEVLKKYFSITKPSKNLIIPVPPKAESVVIDVPLHTEKTEG